VSNGYTDVAFITICPECGASYPLVPACDVILNRPRQHA